MGSTIRKIKRECRDFCPKFFFLSKKQSPMIQILKFWPEKFKNYVVRHAIGAAGGLTIFLR